MEHPCIDSSIKQTSGSRGIHIICELVHIKVGTREEEWYLN